MTVHGLLALSTLLFLVTVADWIHSIRYSETLVLVRGPIAYAIDNFNGEVAFWRGEFKPGKSFPDGLYHEHWVYPNTLKTLQFAIDDPTGGEADFVGFVITQQRHFPTNLQQTFTNLDIGKHTAIALPLWFLTLLFGALPAHVAFRWLRGRRRHVEGLCPVCGYDLRATTDRCPECGTPITPQTPTAEPERQTLL